MGVKLRFYRGAWWIFIDHHGKRRAKRIGDHQTALRIAKELRERLGRADLHLPLARAETLTFKRYSQKWLDQARLNLKASTVRFYERAQGDDRSRHRANAEHDSDAGG